MPYYKRYQDDGKKLSSEERIERIKHTIEELKSYISILESEISNEDDRITEYGE
jgi:prefoldin subunit 5